MEPNLWEELKVALASPENADLRKLCDLLKWVVTQLPEPQQLDTAGNAIEQIVNVYALRFQVMLGGWGEWDDPTEDALPVLDVDALETWVRQSMSIDLDAFVEQPQSKRQRRQRRVTPEDTLVAVVEPEAVLQMVDYVELEQSQLSFVQQLAGEEDPAKWSAAITNWMQRNSSFQGFYLTDLLRELPLSWVEIWLGLLLGQFELEQRGEFYANEIVIHAHLEVG